eukprot:scaffold13742_cov46-Attheya_sp.AAC.1
MRQMALFGSASPRVFQRGSRRCYRSVTVGTQAAVLAGLDVTMFIEFNPPDNEAWVSQKKYR